MHEQNTIQQLAAQGWSRRRIARELKLDRKTVRRYLDAVPKSPTLSTPGPATAEAKSPGVSTPGGETAEPSPPAPPPSANPPGSERVLKAVAALTGRRSACEVHRAQIALKLEAGLSAQRIYQDLVVEVQFTASYQAVKRFVRRLRRQQPERVWRLEVQPGEEVQVDFGRGAPVIDAQGRRRRTWVLRVVLSYSRKAYSEAVFEQTTENLIRCLENAFRSFGGVVAVINLDNLRAAVQKPDWCDPELNPKLVAFCRHYGCTLVPCRVRTPEHKGKTERGLGYLKDNGLRGRTFPALATHNEFLRHWESTVADVRIHGTTRQQVRALFAQEQKVLRPLPPDLFPCFKEGQRTVHRDSYVEVEKAYYTVPPEYIGRSVWVRWDSREVRIFNQRWEQIHFHARLAPGQFDQVRGWGGGHGSLERQRDYWLQRAQAMGEPCGLWAQAVLQHKGPLGLRSIMGLLDLAHRAGFKPLNEACASALSRGALRLRDVRALLDQRQREIQTHLDFARSHPLLRNLAEYGLFIQTKSP
ncbi:MAG: IS21 family transposase [Sulfuricaulis sp.]